MRVCARLIGIICVVVAVTQSAPVAWGDVAPPSANSVLALDAQEPDDVEGSNPALLLRELARQTILIAARDGLGLATRDRTLREPFPGGTSVLRVRTLAFNGKSLHFWLSRDGQVLFDKEVPLGGEAEYNCEYGGVTAELEKLSRGQFIDVLTRAGYSPRSVQPAGNVSLPPGVDRQLSEFNFLSQFVALRQLHATVREQGESLALLCGLARGYANLAQLTQFHWTASHKAFNARSLLYAQRALALYPESTEAAYGLAYARAMAGLHAEALAQLDAADARAKASGVRPPPWAALLRNYCRYNTSALSAVVDSEPGEAPLASYLCFLTIVNSGSTAAVLRYGRIAENHNPLCLAIPDAMCDWAGVGPLHQLTTHPTVVFAQALQSKLVQMPGLPVAVRQALPGSAQQWQEPHAAAAAARALVNSGARDSSEPSLDVLGRLIQETHFAQVRRRAEFLAKRLGVDASDDVAATRPLVDDHPYRNLIEWYGRKDTQGLLAASALLKDIDIVDVEAKEKPLIALTDQINTPGKIQGHIAFRLIDRHADDAAPDLELAVLSWDTPQTRNNPARLHGIETTERALPFSPQATAARIEADWDKTAPRAGAIEKEWGDHPTVAMALARQYHRLNRPDDAARCLRRYIAKTPDIPAYQMLARIALDKGDEAGWLKTLQQALQLEDLGLEHAAVNREIATHFMEQGKFEKALPYANAAASSGASWAIRARADCQEGLGHLSNAESLIREISQRYTDQSAEWYFWCVRTGGGDIAGAQLLADAFLANTKGRTEFLRLSDHALYELLQNRPAGALPLFERQLALYHDPWSAMHVALLKESMHDAAGRDAALEAAEHPPGFMANDSGATQIPQLAAMFRKCYQGGPHPRLDSAAAEKLLASSQSHRTSCLYFIGRFLDLGGDHDGAKAYYQRCCQTLDHTIPDQVLAAWELRGRRVPTPSVARYFHDPTILVPLIALVLLALAGVIRANRNR